MVNGVSGSINEEHEENYDDMTSVDLSALDRGETQMTDEELFE